jgi:hypothetical protein
MNTSVNIAKRILKENGAHDIFVGIANKSRMSIPLPYLFHNISVITLESATLPRLSANKQEYPHFLPPS